MNENYEPLFEDQFTGEPPAKRAMAYIQSRREKGTRVAGVYCSYAPLELIHAMDMVPAILCAFVNKPIEAAEEVLPANLCPLIKSSYGYIITDTCPFYAVSDVVIGETTCDGKKKMFELICDIKPTFVMDLPQLPDDKDAADNWARVIRKLQFYLEINFNKQISDQKIEGSIKDLNYRNRLMRKVFEYASSIPTVISWSEIYDITFLANVATGKDMGMILEPIYKKLDKRAGSGYHHGNVDAPRVLVTGSPIGGDATKVFKIIEEAGGVIVGLDSCTGMKTYLDSVEEGAKDPVKAIAERYLRIPCSCMTPNDRRLQTISNMIKKFKPDVIVDVILHACHAYNIESHTVGEHVKKKHNMPFLKIVTDYSDGDIEQIRTRVETLLNTI